MLIRVPLSAKRYNMALGLSFEPDTLRPSRAKACHGTSESPVVLTPPHATIGRRLTYLVQSPTSSNGAPMQLVVRPH